MPGRRSKKVKNLEEEVESVFFQDESNDCKSQLNENQKMTETLQNEQISEDTSNQRETQTVVLQDVIQTPRRSCRKSIRPTQDYDDIVKRPLRSCTRSGKKAMLAESENDENDDVNTQPRWTPAKVGRVSQKRSRKSKRVEKGRKLQENNTEQDAFKKEEGREAEHILEMADEVEQNLGSLADSLKQTNEMKQGEEQTKDAAGNVQCMNVNIDCLDKPDEKDHANSVFGNDSTFKIHNRSAKLLREDSEDDLESTEKPEPEGICIIYENNIGNENDTQSESPKSISSVKGGESFGCYLKSGDINISDLGLNPISQEDKDENISNQIKRTSSKDVEEMPSLIICDDDDEICSKQTRTLNETFEADEKREIENCQKQNEEPMEILQLSDDDCETPRKCPRIIVTDTSAQKNIRFSNTKKDSNIRPEVQSTSKPFAGKLLHTSKQSHTSSAIKAKLPSTPKAGTPKLLSTPQQTRKQYRFPTPYRKRDFKFDDEIKENIQEATSKNLNKGSVFSFTTLEPKEIILRGIRKRSSSFCVNEQKRNNILAEPLRKQKKNRMVSFHSPANQTTIIDDLDVIIEKSVKKLKLQDKQPSKKFVTTRRKRSLSLDETFMSPSIASRLPRPVLIQNVANKAKNTASNSLKRTKLPNFAAIHEKQFNKMENLVDHVSRKQERSKNLINSATKFMSASAQKNITLNKSINYKIAEKPRALKKIDLNPNIQKNEKSDLRKKPAVLKKPAFNLSTYITVKPAVVPASNFAEKANTSRLFNDSKMESRLQRHMELFKGRTASTRTGSASRKNEVILKGVRSNRRFELQMQHRKNLEQ